MQARTVPTLDSRSREGDFTLLTLDFSLFLYLLFMSVNASAPGISQSLGLKPLHTCFDTAIDSTPPTTRVKAVSWRSRVDPSRSL